MPYIWGLNCTQVPRPAHLFHNAEDKPGVLFCYHPSSLAVSTSKETSAALLNIRWIFLLELKAVNSRFLTRVLERYLSVLDRKSACFRIPYLHTKGLSTIFYFSASSKPRKFPLQNCGFLIFFVEKKCIGNRDYSLQAPPLPVGDHRSSLSNTPLLRWAPRPRLCPSEP